MGSITSENMMDIQSDHKAWESWNGYSFSKQIINIVSSLKLLSFERQLVTSEVEWTQPWWTDTAEICLCFMHVYVRCVQQTQLDTPYDVQVNLVMLSEWNVYACPSLVPVSSAPGVIDLIDHEPWNLIRPINNKLSGHFNIVRPLDVKKSNNDSQYTTRITRWWAIVSGQYQTAVICVS